MADLDPSSVDRDLSAEAARRELYEVIELDVPFEEKADRALAIGERYLDVDNGHLARIDPESDYWRAIASTDPPEGQFPTGLQVDLSVTYCRRTVQSDTSIALYDAEAQGWEDDPAFEEHGLHCYHGTPLVVDGDLYGTVCFVSVEPRSDPFTPAETTFAELLARMLAREIERDHAAARIERLEEFADVLSHDLRNPLNVAQGRIDMARERTDEENLRIAARSLDRIEAIISSVLAVAREGRDVEETEPVRLSALAERCFETVETSESTLHVDDDFRFHADPDRIRGIFENLFRNSIEHGSASPCSGTREGADEQRDGVTIHVGPLHDGDGFYVADDGPGIPESERETVFEAGHTTGSEGIGIGLAIVESIVEAHGWSIEITDAAGGGARFEVSGAIPAE
jgi:signal transduction histidine kinase